MEKMKPITKTQYMENAVKTLESQKEGLSINVSAASSAAKITATAPIPTERNIITSNATRLSSPIKLVTAENNIAFPA